MISVHADHVIQGAENFLNDLRVATEVALHDQLTLLSVPPEYPETGYGYIEASEPFGETFTDVFQVAAFKEKPDYETAVAYIKKGHSYWNTGLFVWKVSVLKEEFQKFLPTPIDKLEAVRGDRSFTEVDGDQLAAVYQELPKIAIDNAVLEQSGRVAMVKAHFGWKDVGSWDALGQIFKVDDAGNYLRGETFAKDCHGMTVDTDGPFVATLGCEDLVVVCAQGAVLVCPKSKAQDVKHVVTYLQDKGLKQYL